MVFRLIVLSLLFTTPLLFISIPHAHASSCEHHQKSVDNYNQKRRAGGSNLQMNRWLQQRNYHREQLAQCIREERNHSIQRTSGNSGNTRHFSDHRQEITTNSPHEAVRKQYQTCNFWIREHNHRPSGDTLAQRNAACNSAQKSEREFSHSPVTDIEHVRTLKDCIKPGNLIDNDVSACLQGKVIPVWNHP